MKLSPKCRTKKMGMSYTILGSFCSFLNWEGVYIWPQIRPRKIPEAVMYTLDYMCLTLFGIFYEATYNIVRMVYSIN